MKRILLITLILAAIFSLIPAFAEETQLFYLSVENPGQGTINSCKFPLDPPGAPAGPVEVPLNEYARLYLTAESGYEPAGFYINGVFSEGGLYEYKVESILDPVTVIGSFRPVQDTSSQSILIVSPNESGVVKTGTDNTVTIVLFCEWEANWEEKYQHELYKNGILLQQESILDASRYLRRYTDIPLDQGDNILMVKVTNKENAALYNVDFVVVHYSADVITDNNKAAVLIDERLYSQPGLADRLNEYVSLASQRNAPGFGISVIPVNGIDDWSSDQVRNYIGELKNTYKALEGVLLVGNIKLPSFFKPGDEIQQSRLFTHKYEDLDIVLEKNSGTSADYDYMEKGVNPLPGLWCAVMPVGFDNIPEHNTYEDFALQFLPYLDKLLNHYTGGNNFYNLYQLSDRMWDLSCLEIQWGLSGIHFYSVNDTGLGPYHWCPEATTEMFYKSFDNWYMLTYPEVSKYYRRFPWIGEGWQSKDIYTQHMNNSGYSIVWTNVDSSENSSVITTEEAKILTNGGIILMATGGSAGGFAQHGPASFTDTGIYPDGNILCGYVYGNSNCITAMGSPFSNDHESKFENLSAFLAQGDYAGKAHFFRKCLQYHISGSNPGNLAQNTQEILIGDPFVKLGDLSESDTTLPTTPQNLVCTDKTSSTITIQWDPSTDDGGISEYRIRTTDADLNTMDSWVWGDTMYVVSLLIPDMTYSIMVTAVDNWGNIGNWSEPVTETTLEGSRPTTPQNLAYTEKAERKIVLQWDASSSESGIVEYQLYLTANNEFYDIPITSNTSFTFDWLEPQTTYNVRVQAIDSVTGNTSPWTDSITFTTDKAFPPSVPLNPAVADIIENSVILTWDPSTDETGVAGYEICYADTEGYHGCGAETTSVQLYSLQSQYSYKFYIRAYDTTGNYGVWSAPVTAITETAVPPSIPQNLTAAGITENSVDLNWDPSTDDTGIHGYFVYYSSPGGYTTSVWTQANSIWISSLTPNTTYTFKVGAIDNIMNAGGLSDPLSVTTNSLEPPTIPENLNATGIMATSINLTWDPSTGSGGIQGYFIRAVENSGYELPYFTPDTFFTLSNLDPDTIYNIAVKANGNNGESSDWSLPITVTTLDTTRPSAPENLACTGKTDISISISWDTPTSPNGISSYQVSYTGPDGYDYRFPTATLTTATLDFLDPDSTYTIKVRAYDNNYIAGLWSDPITVTTNPLIPPTVPQNLRVTGISDVSVLLEWDPSTDDTGVLDYYITRLDPDGGSNLYHSYVTSVIAYCEPSTTYTFKVQARDTSGNYSDYSDPVTVTTNIAIPPTAPQNLRATSVTDVYVTLEWDPSTDDTGIEYYYIDCSDTGGNTNGYSTSDTQVTLYLNPSTTYTFKVQAYDTSYNASEWSTPVTVTTYVTIPPTVPQNLTVADLTESSAGITWEPSTDDLGILYYYILYYGEGENEHYASSETNQLVITTLTPDLTYTVMVRAVDTSYNSSDWSDPLSFTTSPAPPDWTPYPTPSPTPTAGISPPLTPGITSSPGDSTPMPTPLSTGPSTPDPTPVLETPEPTMTPTEKPTPCPTPATPAPTPKPHKTHHPHKTPRPMHTPKHERPDLCPLRIIMTGTPKANSEIILESGISNKGTKDSGRFKVKWVINGKTKASSGYTNIPAGQTVKDEGTRLSWIPLSPGRYRISFIVDTENNVHEWNNFNNVSFTTIFIRH